MKKISIYFFAIAMALLVTRCAKMGSLTGGPKDEDPPRLIESEPKNYSLNFDGEKIEITFDEYIQLDNVNQELVVSPPLENQTDVRLKNKSILIELENELYPNTTYTLNFGGAIKDNNEGNPLTNFEFVFSTGDYLDSLSIGGILYNAFDLKPSEDPVNIMLYDRLDDSVVFKETPVYVGKTNEDGTFRINNLKADTFKLFALKDVNNNFLFDLPNEEIAFLDTTLILDPDFFKELFMEEDSMMEEESDSLVNRTNASVAVDSIRLSEADSIKQARLAKLPEEVLVNLFLFTEENETQFLSDYNRKQNNLIDFTFNLPVTDSFKFRSLLPYREDWYLKTESSRRDSFQLWITDKEVSAMDTVLVEINYTVNDSLKNKVTKTDTLSFTFRKPSPESSRKTKKEKDEVEKMDIRTFRNNATIELNQKVRFVSRTPVNYADTSLIEFYIKKDSLEQREPYGIIKDTANILNFLFQKEWQPEGEYHFIAYPGAFMDVYGSTHDTIDTRIKVREEDYYGTLIVTIDTVECPLIFQLMDTKDKVLREIFIKKGEEVRFPYLKPDKYKIKLIYDENGNNSWDTGKYIKYQQPEKIQFYKGEIDVRANWEMAVKMKFSDYKEQY